MTPRPSTVVQEFKPLGASYRDPSGFVFLRNGVLLRQVNTCYERDYSEFLNSGLYSQLSSDRMIVSHEEVSIDHRATESAYKVIQPELIPFISYPYEWSFSGLKDAALLTLSLAKRALEKGMVLKDASAYNVQFRDGHPIFIDSLSFERYVEGEPWIAYGQFCRHFLAPLALMALVDIRLGALQLTYRDGLPLDLASKLLPRKTWLKPGLLAHIHAHAKADARSKDEKPTAGANLKVSKTSVLGLLDSLEQTITQLKWVPAGTVWGDYYAGTNYSESAMASKHTLVREFLGEFISANGGNISTCWDLGANNGEFSQLATELGLKTVAWDVDPAAVEKAYSRYKAGQGALPLLLDLTNPWPAGGWANGEQAAFSDRGPVDVVMALALVHHLAIGSNVPLPKIAQFLALTGKMVVIEFVPKTDSQAQRLLRNREDIFENYSEEGFESAVEPWFVIDHKAVVPGTQRTLYGLRKRVVEAV